MWTVDCGLWTVRGLEDVAISHSAVEFILLMGNALFFSAAHSYDQVTNFLQGYVDNELNFNTEDSCKQNCADYTKTKNFQCVSETVCGETQTQHRHLSVCKGDVRDCVDLGDIDTFVCHVSDTTRRYDFIQYSNGQFVGLTLSDRCEFESKVGKPPIPYYFGPPMAQIQLIF